MPKFELDLSDQRKLTKIYKAAPRKFQRATAGYLNSLAFKARPDQIASINRTMTVRNPRFVNSKIRVKTTKPSTPIDRQAATVGSIRGPRFSGWTEQERGTGDKRDRTISEQARGGSDKRQVMAKARLKRTANFHRVQEFRTGRHKTYGQALVAMLRESSQGRLKRPFIITKGGGPGNLSKYRHGLYGNKGRRVVRYQTFRKRPPRAKITHWHSRGIATTLRRVNKRVLWGQQIKRAFKV